MGRRAAELFEEAEKAGGLTAKARLAALARITSTEAASVDDTPELLGRLRTALTEVQAARPAPASEALVTPSASGTREAKALRRQVHCLADLMSQRDLFLGNVDKTVRRVTEAATSTLEVARVSVWTLDDQRTRIVCLDLFERSGAKHSSGIELLRKDFGAYFDALGTERTIAAHDAHTDPRTSCFSPSYLRPLGIGAMLDVPIWVKGAMKGVICHEHIGARREWTTDDESFAYVLSTIVALSMERR